jgi:hypothetical protein
MDPRFFRNRMAALPKGAYPFEQFLSTNDAQHAREVIGGFPNYSPTPLAQLPNVASASVVEGYESEPLDIMRGYRVLMLETEGAADAELYARLTTPSISPQ